MMKRELYSVENEKISRQRRFCPRCGPGVFLAEHPNRFSCGKCGYTETKKESSKAKPQADAKKESGKGKSKK
jgi:small subunit ribosomal protein S27Ae